jgi:hypothetical protein
VLSVDLNRHELLPLFIAITSIIAHITPPPLFLPQFFLLPLLFVCLSYTLASTWFALRIYILYRLLLRLLKKHGLCCS